MTAIPKLAALLALAALAPGEGRARDAARPGHVPAVRSSGGPIVRPYARTPARPYAHTAVSDSVRRLNVAIVLLTSSFNKVLTPAEVERVHEEVAEFHAF